MAKILYLEDEAWQVQHTVVIFIEKELGHTVTLVKSTAEAEKELSTTPYDAVFLDIMLDSRRGLIELENSGLQIAQHILDGRFVKAGNPSTLPIVIASGVWDATVRDATGKRLTVEEWARSLHIPSSCFLRKPFLEEEVREILNQLFRMNPEEQP